MDSEQGTTGLVGRARAASVSVMNMKPQLGVWQAAGTAIAQAPNLTELREPESGGSNITFDAHGHSTRMAKPDDSGELVLVKTKTNLELASLDTDKKTAFAAKHPHRAHLRSLREKHQSDVKEKWGPTLLNGLKAFWKFFLTPSGFLVTIYALNIVVSSTRQMATQMITTQTLQSLLTYPHRLGAPCSSSYC